MHTNLSTNESHPRVLLAEDDSDAQMILTHILTEAGAYVVATSNGQECLDEALAAWDGKIPFDVILLDLMMPVMDGTQTARELRSHGYNLPIVAITARSTDNDEQASLDAGCDAYVSKLSGKDALLNTVAKHMRKRGKPASSEISVLPSVPNVIHQNPEYIKPVISFLGRLPDLMLCIESAMTRKDWHGIKAYSIEMSSASLYGYLIFAGLLKRVQTAAECENGAELSRLIPQLQHAAKSMLAGKVLIEAKYPLNKSL